MAPLIALRRIDEDNREQVVAVGPREDQLRFVGTVAAALQDAADYPEAKPWFRAVYRGREPVGFVMVSWDVEPDPPHIIGPWFLWKLIIDREAQRQGFGREVVRLVSEIVRGEGASDLLTSYVEGKNSPAGFYARLGFRPTGERDENDEVIVSLDLWS